MCLYIKGTSLKILDAINNILPHLGEAVVTSVDARHPTVALIVQALTLARQSLLAEGWWFNEEQRTLYVNPDGFLPTPTNLLALYSNTDTVLEPRGEFIYNLSAGTGVFTPNTSHSVRLVVDLPFEHLPTYAAMYLQYSAAVTVYTQDFGVEKVVTSLSQSAAMAYNMLEQEELRKRKYTGTANRAMSEIAMALRG